MCWLVRAGAAVESWAFGSHSHGGAAGLGAAATGKIAPCQWLEFRCFQGHTPPHPPSQQGFGAPTAGLSFPVGRWGDRGSAVPRGCCGSGRREVGWFSERVAQEFVGMLGTHALHLPRLGGEQDPSSPPPATVTSRAAALPGAGTRGQAEPWRATSMSPPYLFTPFLITLLVRAPQRVTSGFASGGGGWVG